MKKRTPRLIRWVAVAWALVVFLGAGFRVLADCASFGLPFTDLGSVSGFCAAIAEAYYTGITNGTSPTTFSPTGNVTRGQAAAFATRTLDAALVRGSRRAALGQWWTTTPRYDSGLGLTSVGNGPQFPASDGSDIWVPNFGDATVSRIRASDGASLGTWTGAVNARAALVAMGKVFVVASTSPGSLYMIDPAGPPGPVTTVANTIGFAPLSIAFDGSRIWTANGQNLSIVTPGSTIPWSVTNVTNDTFFQLDGILFDGSNIWVTDVSGALLRLDSAGTILQTVTLPCCLLFPTFDGRNIWVPNGFDALHVIRASDGAVVKTFSDVNGDQNGLADPVQAAFDGQRVLVTNQNGGLSLFNATDLRAIGNSATPGVINPLGVCSDGVNFWVSFAGSGSIGRF